jgi:putative transposase
MRTERYRRLFQHALEPGELDEIRAATNGNYALAATIALMPIC